MMAYNIAGAWFRQEKKHEPVLLAHAKDDSPKYNGEGPDMRCYACYLGVPHTREVHSTEIRKWVDTLYKQMLQPAP